MRGNVRFVLTVVLVSALVMFAGWEATAYLLRRDTVRASALMRDGLAEDLALVERITVSDIASTAGAKGALGVPLATYRRGGRGFAEVMSALRAAGLRGKERSPAPDRLIVLSSPEETVTLYAYTRDRRVEDMLTTVNGYRGMLFLRRADAWVLEGR